MNDHRIRRSALAGLASAGLLALAVPGGTAFATPSGYCENPPPAAEVIEPVPWPVRAFDAPERLWPFSTGEGVTVAVLSTGVDADHPQLQGKVLNGADLVDGKSGGYGDCAGPGTAAASVIAGAKVDGVGFEGLAPGAKIMPVRVSVDLSSGGDQLPEPRPGTVAKAITASAEGGADIILVPQVITYSEELEQATAAAIEDGVIVVAAAGDQHQPELPPMQPTPAEFTPYPAAFDGVIGVGAIGVTGERFPASQIGEYVDLVAPGVDVVAAANGGQQAFSSTEISASYVAATLALMLADPRLGLQDLTGAAKVAAATERLLGTASPNGSDNPGLGFGAGAVDPYRALNEPMGAGEPVEQDDHVPYELTDTEIAAAAAERDARGTFSAIATTGALVLVGGGFVTWIARRVRGSGGRVATSVVAPRSADAPDEFVPGSALFEPKSIDD